MGTDARKLIEQLGLDATYDAPLGPLTWYGVGGSAEALVEAASVDEVAAVLAGCDDHDIPLRVLGKGANLLVADTRVPGVVLRLGGPAFRRIEIEGSRLVAGGGAELAQVINASAKAGLAGLEGLAGIPATIGGAIRMNAGGKWGEIAQAVHHVTCLTRRGERVEHDREECGFAYRTCAITDPIIVEATFDLTPGDPVALRERVKELYQIKGDSQPLGAKSAGCVFRNPPSDVNDEPAGMLIDRAGLKGYRIGTAEVSTRHANFIVVDRNGSANDVIELIRHVRHVVSERTGTRLEAEVVIWPELEDDA